MKRNNIILIIFILMVTPTFAQVPLKHLIGSKNYPNSLSSCEVYISTSELKSNKAIISFVLTASKPSTSTINNRIAEGWVNLVIAEDAEVDYKNIKYFGSTSPNSQTNSLFDPNYKLDKLTSEIAGNFLSFTILGDLINMADATQNINDYLFKTKHEVPDFDFNQFDQVNLPFNAPNKYSKIQIDIPVLFGNNKVIGTGAYWEVLGFNKSGQGFRTGENAGVYFDKFNIEEKLDANSVSTTNLNSDFSGKSGTFVDERDGRVYKWVKIGEQVWMAENLQATKYNDEIPIPNVTDNISWKNLYSGTYCWYNNDASKYQNLYGAIYNWYAVKTGKLCPIGWHVPTDEEWKKLEMALGMTKAQANAVGWRGFDQETQMKATNGWHDNRNGTNSSGFSALPGGYRLTDGQYNYGGIWGHWWSSTEYYTDYAWYRYLRSYYTITVGRGADDKRYGFSVRCVRD